MGKGLILAAALALAACQTTGPKGTFCEITRLEDVRPSKATIEAMTPEQRERTLALLKKGAKLCGWRP